MTPFAVYIVCKKCVWNVVYFPSAYVCMWNRLVIVLGIVRCQCCCAFPDMRMRESVENATTSTDRWISIWIVGSHVMLFSHIFLLRQKRSRCRHKNALIISLQWKFVRIFHFKIILFNEKWFMASIRFFIKFLIRKESPHCSLWKCFFFFCYQLTRFLLLILIDFPTITEIFQCFF